MGKNDGGIFIMETILQEVAVIVLNYVSYSMTIECVDRIKASKCHIVIVDNCSPNNSFELLFNYYKEVANVSVIKSDRNGGYAYGNNVGIRWAEKNITKIKYISIMNPDVILDEKTLASLVTFLNEHEKVAVVAPLVIESNKKTIDSMGWKLWNKKELLQSAGYFFAKRIQKKSEGELVVEDGHIVHYVDVVKGCFFVTKLKTIMQMGLLDEETFMYGEEDIFAYKVKKSNLKEAVLIDQYCKHDHIKVSDKAQLLRIQKHVGKTYESRRILLKKYYRANRLELLWYDFAVAINVHVMIPIAYYIKRGLK